MSHIKAIRDAVVTHLGTMALGVTVVSDWVPMIERDKLAGVELHVFPIDFQRTTASRVHKTRVAKIGLLLVEPQTQGQESSQAESAQVLGDELETLLDIRIGGYLVKSIEQPMIVDHDEWRTNRKLSTTFILTLESTAI